MSSSYGKNLTVTIFGQSHSAAIGVTMDGFPAGFPVDMEALGRFLARRAPGGGPLATPRKEADAPEFLCGLVNNITCGAPLTAVIRNTNVRPQDYAALQSVPRPGHADYTANVRYGGHQDASGGGHFSGRLTAPLVFAGSVARDLLKEKGVTIGAHIASIANVNDEPLDPVNVDAQTLERLAGSRFPLLCPEKEENMRCAVALAREARDSVGGVIECAAVGVPAGIGSPFFGSVESVVSQLAFSIPAVKAVEFGDGRLLAGMCGSQANDPMRMRDGQIICTSNHNGGVTGGITNGMPVVFRAAVKPTPSIAQEQQTIDVGRRENTQLVISGRHDPCIVPRAVVVVESVLAIALCELMMDDAAQKAMGTGEGTVGGTIGALPQTPPRT